jgi:hypothetical protein
VEYRHSPRCESVSSSSPYVAQSAIETDTDPNPSHPQVIKSRLQSAPNGTYNGFADCVRKTIKADGVGALWKGFSAAMARAVPANVSSASKRDIIERRCEDGEADVLCFDRVVTGRYVCRCRVVSAGHELAVVDEGVLGRSCACKQGTGDIWVAKGAADHCRSRA